MHAVTWSSLQFMVFDSPNKNLLKKPYETRYSHLKSVVPQGEQFLIFGCVVGLQYFFKRSPICEVGIISEV